MNARRVLDRNPQVGELGSAVGELEKLEGSPRATVRDWLADAKTRLAAEDALKIIRCHASLLSAKHLGVGSA